MMPRMNPDAQQTLKVGDEHGTRSNSAKARFPHALTACAMATIPDPAMQPYVILRAIKDGLINESSPWLSF